MAVVMVLLNGLFSVHRQEGERIMNWKRCGRKRSQTYMRCFSNILLKGLKKITEAIRLTGLWTEI